MLIAGLILGAACAAYIQNSPTPRQPDISEPSANELFQQGLSLFNQFKYQEAKGMFDQVIDKDPTHTQAFYYRGRILLQLKETDAADRDFNRCQYLDSNYVYGYTGKAQIFILNKKYPDALQQINKAFSLDSRNAEAFFQKGNMHAYQKQWNAAIASYKECLAVQPNHAYAHYSLGLTYNQVNKKDLTIDHFLKFLNLAPNAPEAEQVRRLLSQLQK
jgi:tetratricopeptide (TPR) repeat protein